MGMLNEYMVAVRVAQDQQGDPGSGQQGTPGQASRRFLDGLGGTRPDSRYVT